MSCQYTRTHFVIPYSCFLQYSRFQPVVVPEPSIEESYEILQGLRERYEAHHKLRYTDEALMAAAKYSSQYISDRFLPDKAIDLIDEAGSRVRLRHIQLPEEARELDKELKQVTKDKDAAVRGQDFEKAGQLRDREMELKAKISAIISGGWVGHTSLTAGCSNVGCRRL